MCVKQNLKQLQSLTDLLLIFETISWISTTGYVGNFQMIYNKAWLPRIYSTQGLTGYNTLDGENLTGFGVK